MAGLGCNKSTQSVTQRPSIYDNQVGRSGSSAVYQSCIPPHIFNNSALMTDESEYT